MMLCRRLIIVLLPALPPLSAATVRQPPLPAWSLIVIAVVFLVFLGGLHALYRARLRIKALSLDLESKTRECARLQLELETLTDSPTGFGNRRHIFTVMARDLPRIQREYKTWLQGGSFAPVNGDVVFTLLEVDHFQGLLETHGKGLEEGLRRHIRDLMRQVVRDSDVLVPWDDGRFLAVFRQANRDSGSFLSERLRHAVNTHPYETANGIKVPLSCSLGFSCFPFVRQNPDQISWEEVVEIAGTALELGRRKGPNQWFGLYGTSACLENEDLFGAICKDPHAMISEGVLRASCAAGEAMANHHPLSLKQ